MPQHPKGTSIDARLEELARATGRSKEFYLKELIQHGMEGLEDAYLGALELTGCGGVNRSPDLKMLSGKTLAWTVEFSSGAERQLRKLDPDTARRLALYLGKLVAETTDPRERGKALLILSAQAEEDLLLNDSLGRVVGCTDDEIREAAPLQLSRPLQGGINACR